MQSAIRFLRNHGYRDEADEITIFLDEQQERYNARKALEAADDARLARDGVKLVCEGCDYEVDYICRSCFERMAWRDYDAARAKMKGE